MQTDRLIELCERRKERFQDETWFVIGSGADKNVERMRRVVLVAGINWTSHHIYDVSTSHPTRPAISWRAVQNRRRILRGLLALLSPR